MTAIIRKFLLPGFGLLLVACAPVSPDFSGYYLESSGVEGGSYFQSLTIAKKDQQQYAVSFSASRVRGYTGCRFYGEGKVVDGTLLIEISDWQRPSIMMITRKEDGAMEVFTKEFDNRFALMFFCSGGASLAGLFSRHGEVVPKADYLITNNSVGVYYYAMTMQEVIDRVPAEQLQKKIVTGEFLGDFYDDYYITDSNGTELLVITPAKTNDLSERIDRIRVLDPRFQTAKGVGLNSTYADIRDNYTITELQPDEESIVIEVAELNAWFIIAKTQIESGWWDEQKREIDAAKIPDSAAISGLVIWVNR